MLFKGKLSKWKGGNTPPVIISLNKAKEELRRLFENKTSRHINRISSLISDIDLHKNRFFQMCEEFASMNVEPDNEDIPNFSIEMLKRQKKNYINAILKLKSRRMEKNEWETRYHKCIDEYVMINEFIDRILTLNNLFKSVVLSYQKYIGNIRRTFSLIEKLAERVEEKLDASKLLLDEYNNVNSLINKISLSEEDLHSLEENLDILSSMGATDKSYSDEQKSMELELLSKEKKYLDIISKRNKQISDIKEMLLRLERPARKFDYNKREKFHKFVLDPLDNIKSEEDYSIFLERLRNMQKEIKEGKIKIKNSGDVLATIRRIINTNIYQQISTAVSYGSEAKILLGEIKMIKTTLSDIKQRKENDEKAHKDASIMRKAITQKINNINNLKRSVEKLFHDYYKYNIKILLNKQ